MLNGFGSHQSVALIGAGSDIAKKILESLEQSSLVNVMMISREGNSTFKNLSTAIRGNYSTSEERSKIVETIFSRGDLDLVVIAIGILQGSIEEMTNINYVATVDLLDKITKKMLNQGHGQIVIISSFAQVRPRKENFLYGSTKAGLDFFARGLSNEIQGTGVTITILRPGFVFSKMTEGLKVAPFAISAELAGKIAAGAIKSKARIRYLPAKLRFIAILIKLIPQSMLDKFSG